MDKRTCAQVNLGAIRSNLRQVRWWIGAGPKIMAVVKANAYGHGIETVSRALADAGADYLAVANTEEARRIREFGVSRPILVFGNPDPLCIRDYFTLDLEVSVSDYETARFVSDEAIRAGRKPDVHLKIDTGMGRYGLMQRDVERELPKIAALPGIRLKALWSHFPNADDASPDFTISQIKRFQDCLDISDRLKVEVELKHVANSAATLYYPDAHFDMVRPGLLLYGYAPQGLINAPIILTPALSLISHVSMVKRIAAGTPVSYGSSWKSSAETDLAVVPIGYADGVTRAVSNRLKVVINGKRYPQVGNVTMDNIMVNLGLNHDVKKMDEVVIFGEQMVTAADVARWSNTIPWEVLCGITGRVPRVYTDKEPAIVQPVLEK